VRYLNCCHLVSSTLVSSEQAAVCTGFYLLVISVRRRLPVYDDDGTNRLWKTRLAQWDFLAPKSSQLGHKWSVRGLYRALVTYYFPRSVTYCMSPSVHRSVSPVNQSLSQSVDQSIYQPAKQTKQTKYQPMMKHKLCRKWRIRGAWSSC